MSHVGHVGLQYPQVLWVGASSIALKYINWAVLCTLESWRSSPEGIRVLWGVDVQESSFSSIDHSLLFVAVLCKFQITSAKYYQSIVGENSDFHLHMH